MASTILVAMHYGDLEDLLGTAGALFCHSQARPFEWGDQRRRIQE